MRSVYALIFLAFFLDAKPGIASGKVVASDRINAGEGYVFKSRQFGDLRLTKLTVKKDTDPKCMIDLTSVEEIISDARQRNTLVSRPMPGNPKSAIITVYLKYRMSGNIPTCTGVGPDCEMEIVVPDAARVLRR